MNFSIFFEENPVNGNQRKLYFSISFPSFGVFSTLVFLFFCHTNGRFLIEYFFNKKREER